MATFRRGRNNKSELNLTSSFIAGGSLYKHHSGTLLGFYRFEEPYSVTNPGHLSSPHMLRVEDSSGYGRYGLITSGNISGNPDEVYGNPVPHRTAISTPYTFNNPLTTAEVLGGEDILVAVSPKHSNQLRVIDFVSGSSERIELPRQLARALTNEITSRPFPHRETYEAGMTFAGWIKMHPVTGTFSIDTQAASTGTMWLTQQSQTRLHGRTFFLTDTAGKKVTFTYDENTAATARETDAAGDYSGAYTVGMGDESSTLTHQAHANLVSRAINLANESGDLGLTAKYGTTSGASDFSWMMHSAYAYTDNKAKIKITISKVPSVGDSITLVSGFSGKSFTYTAHASSTAAPSDGQLTFSINGLSPGSTTQSDLNTVASRIYSLTGYSGNGQYRWPHYLYPRVLSTNNVTLTQYWPGSSGNTPVTIVDTGTSDWATVIGQGLEGDNSTLITTANKFTGGREHNSYGNSKTAQSVTVTQDVGAEIGNTVIGGTVFDQLNIQDYPTNKNFWPGTDHNTAWVTESPTDAYSQARIIVDSVPSNGHIVNISTKDLYGEELKYAIRFQTSGGTDATFTGTYSYGGGNTYAADIDTSVDTTVANIADAINTLLTNATNGLKPDSAGYHTTDFTPTSNHTVTLSDDTLEIKANRIWHKFDLYVDGTAVDAGSIDTVLHTSKMTGSMGGGSGAADGKGVVENKFIAKSIFTTITSSMSADGQTSLFGGGPADNSAKGSDSTGLSLRVISKPGTNKHNTLSWFATHYSGSSTTTESSEWRTNKSLPEDVWTHIAVVYPTGSNLHEYGLHSSVLKNETSPVEPKIFVNGKRQTAIKIPRTAKAQGTVNIRSMPEHGYGLKIVAQASGTSREGFFRYDTTTTVTGKTWRTQIGTLVPTASVSVETSAYSTANLTANHLATWQFQTPGVTATDAAGNVLNTLNFVVDSFHTGTQGNSASNRIFEGGVQEVQKVSPNFSDLGKIHIRYGGLFASTGSNPWATNFIRLTTPNLTTKTYVFDEDRATSSFVCANRTAAQLIDATVQLIDADPTGANTVLFTFKSEVGASSGYGNITGITRANPAVVTTAENHGLSDGAEVWITDVVGMTEVNNQKYAVDVLNATTFALYRSWNGEVLTNPINSTNFTAWDSSGGVSKAAIRNDATNYQVDASGVRSANSHAFLLHKAIQYARYNGDLLINSTINQSAPQNLVFWQIHADTGGNTTLTVSDASSHTKENFTGGSSPDFGTDSSNALALTQPYRSNLLPLHSTASLSNYFRVGAQTVVGSVLTTQPSYNFTGLDYQDILTGTYDVKPFSDDRDGGLYKQGGALPSVPQNTPILVFSPNGYSTPSNGSNFNSQRFIVCEEKFTTDCWVTFKALPGAQDGSSMTSIHANMREKPDSNEGVFVQISVDGNTWYGPEHSVNSAYTVTALAAGSSVTHGVKHYVSGTAAQAVKSTGSPVYDRHTTQEWKQYAFYCNWTKIRSGLSDGANAALQEGYYIRIIQRGYSGWNYDPWALCDIKFTGMHTNNYHDSEAVFVPINKNDVDATWTNLIAAITGSDGHGDEILATQNTSDNLLTLTYKSPIGRMSSGVTAATILTSSIFGTQTTGSSNSIGLLYSMPPGGSVRIENFGITGNETHGRIGVKGTSSVDNYRAQIERALTGSLPTTTAQMFTLSDNTTTNILTLSSVRPGEVVSVPAPTQNTFFGVDGTNTAGWAVNGWANLLGRTIPIDDLYDASDGGSGSSDADLLKAVAARTANVVNDFYYSGTLGVQALPSSSLGTIITLEQVAPGKTNDGAKIAALNSAYNELHSDRFLEVNGLGSYGSTYYYAAGTFSGGFSTFQAPRGPLVPADLMYMGTPPQLLNLFDKQTHPYGFDFPVATKFSNYKHELGGRSPKAAFDDIAFWKRCLSDEEINALYNSKGGTFTPKSGFMSHPPRVTIRENDEMNHQYPTISRFGDKDFNGRYNLYYDATNEQIFHDPYAKAEILFKGRPRDGTWIELVDWAGRTKRFEFNYGKIVRKGNVEVAIHDQRYAADVAKKLIEVINSQSGFGIRADVGSKKEAVILVQSKAGTEGNTSIKNSRKHAKPKMRSKIRAIIPGSFTGGTTSPKVVFPYRLEEGHPIIRDSQPTPNAVTDMVVSGSAHKNILTSPLKHRWEDESISPYDESSAYASFGSEVHSEADDFFTVDTGRDQEFYSTGTLPTLVGHGLHGPLWSKRKIEIDIAPKKSTTLHGHVVTGSTMAYFNFDKKSWEPIGYAGTGSYWKPQRERYSSGEGGLVLTGGFDTSWSHLSSSLPQASVYSVSASSIDGEPASYSGFRQWLDKTYIGFSPSIGMMVAKSDGTVAAAQAPNANNQGKYVLVDGGLSTPVSTFGFPFHPKYHATSSQYLNASDYIDRPFLLEKIVYEFEAAVHQSCSIDIRTGGSGSVGTGSYGSAGSYNQHAYINSPTPSFFMLNQRMASLPEKIANKVDVVTVVDGEQRQQNFHYTASIPSRFYLAPPAKTDQPEYVNTIRDLVTFGRFGLFSAGFDEQDFENYVPDPRERLDTVITPRTSRQGNLESFLSASKLTLAMPARSPKVNNSITTFKSEGDFFGNVPATATFQINSRPGNNDAFQIYDATGDAVTFRYNDATAKATPIAYASNEWDIDIVGLTTTDDMKIIAARTYEAIARASRGEAADANGNFTSGISLAATGSANSVSFTINQSLGGDSGNRSNVVTISSGTPFALSNFAGGKNINDDIVLSWGGGRSGTGLMSGRSPFGGEYGAYELAYTVNNNTQTYIVSQSAEDSLVSPYLIMPGDKLVFGWQTPIGTGSMVHHSISEKDGTFEIMKGVGKIVLYGSVLRDEKEEPVNTSNQPLTSNALHEALHFGAEVFDQYDTDPPMFHSGTYLDNHVTGAMLRRVDKDSFGTAAHILSHRKVVSRRSDGNHALGPKSNSSRIYQKRSGFLRGVRATDSRERWYDSMLPDVSDLLKIDRKRLFSPSFGTSGKIANARGAALILGHPKVATGSSTTVGPNDQVWSTWFGAFPFEPRYSGVTRTAGLKTKDVFAPSASGSVDTGTKQLTHIWLGNITGSITVPGLGDVAGSQTSIAPNVSTVSTDMLNIIDHPGLLTDAKNQAGADGIHNPNFSAYAIVTNDHGHGKTGELLDQIRFSNTYGNSVYGSFFETNANFFAKVIFGSGDGSYKFPKLPFWKPIGMNELGYNSTDTFAVTKGVIIRGFRYGLANVLPKFSSAVFRRDNFGHIRDMLEQRQFTRFFTEDGLEEGAVTVSFVERGSNGSQAIEPGSTNSANLDTFCSSSMPYRDGHALDRISQQPDTAEKVSISIDVGLD